MAGKPEEAVLAATAADQEPSTELGCSKCRYSQRGCARCRAPSFQARPQKRTQKPTQAANPSLRKRARKQTVLPLASEQSTAAPRRERGRQTGKRAASKQAAAGAPVQRRTRGTNNEVGLELAASLADAAAPEAPEESRKMAKVGRRHAEDLVRAGAESPEQDVKMAAAEAGTGDEVADAQAAVLDAVAGPDGTSVLVLERIPPADSVQEAKDADVQVDGAGPTPSTSGRSGPSNNSLASTCPKDDMDGEVRRAAFREALRTASVKDGAERKQRFREALQHKLAKSRENGCTSPTSSAGPSLSSERKSGSAKKLAARQSSPEDDAPRGNYRIALWEPPVSPFGLIEEQVYHDPWRLLVACMLLNKTSGIQVRKVLWELFKYAPTAEAAVEADVSKVEAMIRPLGLFRKRAVMFKRFSQEYLEKEWTDPQELHGIGQYAADAYYIFCRGEWRNRAKPADKDLLKYFLWLQQTDGLGTGLTPDVWPHNSAATSKQTEQADGHTEPSAATGAKQPDPQAEVKIAHVSAGKEEDSAAAAAVLKSDPEVKSDVCGEEVSISKSGSDGHDGEKAS